jgi:hypothetical protein
VGRIVLGCYKPLFIVEACQGLYFIGLLFVYSLSSAPWGDLGGMPSTSSPHRFHTRTIWGNRCQPCRNMTAVIEGSFSETRIVIKL